MRQVFRLDTDLKANGKLKSLILKRQLQKELKSLKKAKNIQFKLGLIKSRAKKPYIVDGQNQKS